MPTGVLTSYDLTVGVVIDMDEAIWLLSPEDTPLLTGQGGDGVPILPTRPVRSRVFSWLDDTILTPRSKVAAVITADTQLTVFAGDQLKFSTGDVVRIAKAGGAGSGETIRVTGYSATTADILLVSRALTGSATTYASDSILIGMGTALAEGSDPEAARANDRVEASNVTQIFGPTAVHMSRTEQVVNKYGINNEFSHQLMARMKENAIAREQAYLYGAKYDSTTTKIRTTGGMAYWITTNVNSTATQLTVANIQTLQQTNYNAGGTPDVLMANPSTLSDLNDLANTSHVRVEIVDSRRGRARVSLVDTEFGSVTVVRNRWVASHDAFLYKRGQAIRRVLTPLIYEVLAKTGDADKGQIVCEEGLEFKGEEHAARFSLLSYSGGN